MWGPHPSNEAKRKKGWVRKTQGRSVVAVIVDVAVEVVTVVEGSTREVMVRGGTAGSEPVSQPAIGTTRSKGAAHALGYEHPEIGVGAGVVSLVLYHPSILSFVAV